MVLPRYAWRTPLSAAAGAAAHDGRVSVAAAVRRLHLPHESRGAAAGTRHRSSRRSSRSTAGSSRSSCTSRRGFAVFLAALAGPGLIAPDLANNALPLYFSRPLTRWSYALARLTVLVGMLSVVTWVPGLMLFGLQVRPGGRLVVPRELDARRRHRRRVPDLAARAEPRRDGQFRVREMAGRRRGGEPGLLLHPGRRRRDDRQVFRVTWGHILDPGLDGQPRVVRAAGRGRARRSRRGGVAGGAGGVRPPARGGDRAQAAAGGGGPMTGTIPRLRRPGSCDGTPPAVVFDEVSKFYGEVLGVNRVTLNIPPGITSLVGPNGAGQDHADEPDDRPDLPRPRPHPHARDLAARSRSADADHRIRHAVRHGAALGDRASPSSRPGCCCSDTGGRKRRSGRGRRSSA